MLESGNFENSARLVNMAHEGKKKLFSVFHKFAPIPTQKNVVNKIRWSKSELQAKILFHYPVGIRRLLSAQQLVEHFTNRLCA